MNWDQIEGQWKQLQGEAKRHWGKLTDDDLMRIEGDRDTLLGTVQERYGRSKAQVEREIDEWLARLS